MIKNYTKLTNPEKEYLFSFIIQFKPYQAICDMDNDLTKDTLNYGNTFFVLLDKNEVIGTIGLIDKEQILKSEVYITHFYLLEKDIEKASLLIKYVEEYVKDNIKIKLGVRKKFLYLVSEVIKNNYIPSYDACSYQLTNKKLINQIPCNDDIRFTRLNEINKEIFCKIHNESLLYAPNGGKQTEADLLELLQDNNDNKNISKICFYQEEPIGVLDVCLEGDFGNINLIGVSRNYQGKGLSKYLLKEAIDVIYSLGVDDVRLLAINNNEKAIRLYFKYGFTQYDLISRWFEKIK